MRKHKGAESELVASAFLLRNGYEVFRNVSPFGEVDIVAVKDGVTSFFDIKTIAPAFQKKSGGFYGVKLTGKQIEKGVLPLYVFSDGKCQIGNAVSCEIKEYANCDWCSDRFEKQTNQRFCSSSCRSCFAQKGKSIRKKFKPIAILGGTVS